MDRCPRCGASCRYTTSCPWCGLPVATTPPARPPAAPSTTPGTITAVRVLLGFSLAGYASVVVLGVIALAVLPSLTRAVVGMGDDDGTAATLGRLGTLFAVFVVFGVVAAAATGWAIPAVLHRRRTARAVITAVQVLEALVALSGATVLDAATMVAVYVLGLPFSMVLLGLLWGPESSRRWFADQPGRPTPPHPAPSPRPYGATVHVPAPRAPVVRSLQPGRPRPPDALAAPTEVLPRHPAPVSSPRPPVSR